MHKITRRTSLSALLAAWANLGQAQADALQLRGQGRLRFFGLNIYDAALWVAAGFEADSYARHRFTLELQYHRALKGQLIAERSLKEMERVALATGSALSALDTQRWLSAMSALFPDVKAGDRISGEHRPDTGARFLLNGQFIGAVPQPAFSALFFGIWLSPHTSEPALRQALLGTERAVTP